MKLYEVTVGVPDLADAADYFSRFGFWKTDEGALAASDANALYGCDSAVTSWRLRHLDSNHGLIRLMSWEKPVSQGLGLRRNAVLGGRWIAQKTDDLPQIEFHAYLARDRQQPIRIDGPVEGRYAVRQDSRPFQDAIPGARDVVVIQPYFRQLFFSWFLMPNYGAVDPASQFRTSEVAHAAMVIQGDESVLDFYVDVFGMTRVQSPPPGDAVPLQLFGVNETGVTWYKHLIQDGENPPLGDSINPPPGDRNGGRLMAVRFGNEIELEDCRELSRTGSLGMSTYTVRTADLGELHWRIGNSGASNLTPIFPNEFGEPSCSFTAPDGYGWIAVQN
jgi:catechol 2,3-dioxygenase-like lactoylglutathione lyase family enzyme